MNSITISVYNRRNAYNINYTSQIPASKNILIAMLLKKIEERKNKKLEQKPVEGDYVD